MRVRGTVPAGILALLMVAGCDGSASTGGPTASGPSTGPSGLLFLTATTQQPPGHWSDMTWSLDKAPSPQVRAVRIMVSFGGCEEPPEAAWVGQDTTAITLHVLDHVHKGTCVANAMAARITVNLPFSIGHRTILGSHT